MMNEATRTDILALARQAHDLTETAYRAYQATRGDSGWTEKQRLLLADMALHLLQTSVGAGELSCNDLKRNLYAILTVADQFIPDHRLKASADRLLED